MKRTIKQRAILLLCAVMSACMLISVGVSFGNKVIAAEGASGTSVQRKVDLYASNAKDSGATNVIYYDANNNGNRDGNEAFVYTNNGRFNPSSQGSDAALWWTSPSTGALTIPSIKFTHNIEKAKAEVSVLEYDGARFAILKVAADGSFTTLFDWEKLMATKDCGMNSSKSHYVATATKTMSTAIDLTVGEKIAIIVNNGGRSNNSLDQIVVASTLKLKVGETTTEYKFTATSAQAHYTALGNSTEYVLGTETTAYYSWGSADITAPKVTYRNTDKTSTYDSYKVLVDDHVLISASDMSSGDTQFVGWKTADNLYAEGASYAVTGDVAFNDVAFNPVVITLKMEEGAGLRISTSNDDAGIRFSSTYNLSELKSGEYSFGTVILPEDLISNDAPLVKDATAVKDIPAVNFKTADGTITQNAVITGIPENQFTRKLQARGYVTVTYKDGATKTFYTGLSDARSVAYVAYNTYDQLSKKFDFANNEQLKNVVEAFKNAYDVTQGN